MKEPLIFFHILMHKHYCFFSIINLRQLVTVSSLLKTPLISALSAYHVKTTWWNHFAKLKKNWYSVGRVQIHLKFSKF